MNFIYHPSPYVAPLPQRGNFNIGLNCCLFYGCCISKRRYVSNHENTLSLLAQPHASKFLLRLRSHSLRSEAALKDFRWFADIPAYKSITCKQTAIHLLYEICTNKERSAHIHGRKHFICHLHSGLPHCCLLLPAGEIPSHAGQVFQQSG